MQGPTGVFLPPTGPIITRPSSNPLTRVFLPHPLLIALLLSSVRPQQTAHNNYQQYQLCTSTAPPPYSPPRPSSSSRFPRPLGPSSSPAPSAASRWPRLRWGGDDDHDDNDDGSDCDDDHLTCSLSCVPCMVHLLLLSSTTSRPFAATVRSRPPLRTTLR